MVEVPENIMFGIKRCTSNAIKGMFPNPNSYRCPIRFEIHPCGDTPELLSEASDEYDNVVTSICPRIEDDTIIIKLYTRSKNVYYGD